MSARKLYRVSATIDLIVVAESEAEAEQTAADSLRDADGETGAAHWDATPIRSLADLGDAAESLPWGGEGDDETCAEVWKASGAKDEVLPCRR